MVFGMRMALTVWVVLATLGATVAEEAAQPPAATPGADQAAPPANAPATEPAPMPPASTAAQPTSPAPSAPGAAQPKRVAFDQRFSEWKTLLSQLRQLRVDYRSAEPAKKAEIRKQYDAVVGQCDAMVPDLVAKAEEAFLESPDPKSDLAGFLVDIVHWRCSRDEYEEALRLAKVLLDQQVADKSIHTSAGLAAFALGDFDLAEKHFQIAKDNQQITEAGDRYLESIPYYREAWTKESQLRAAEAQANDLPRVRLKTTKGDIVLELFENEAPNTVANFITLVDQGFYNGVAFHRVIPQFMAQDCTGGPGYTIPDECTLPNHRLHFRGSLSMANTGQPDTGGSQFFLTFLPTRHLDGKHTVFGRVIEGMDVLAKLQRRDPESPNPPAPDKILEAKVERRRAHEYTFKKAGQ